MTGERPRGAIDVALHLDLGASHGSRSAHVRMPVASARTTRAMHTNSVPNDERSRAGRCDGLDRQYRRIAEYP